MAWSGGIFSRLYNWVADRDSNIPINASRMDAEMDGIANGITNCVAKDGQNEPTANLPMAAYRHTGVGNASARTDYAAAGQVQDGAITYAADSGAADAYVITLSPAITAYAAGQTFRFKATNANTGASTINVNGVGAKSIILSDGSALFSGRIVAGGTYEIVYNGTAFVLQTTVSDSTELAHVTGGASGTVSAKFDNLDAAYINAADEGVSPSNSAADNTTALHALRTKMLADNDRHWVIFFPPGDYVVTTTRWTWGVKRLTLMMYGCTIRNSAAVSANVDSWAFANNQEPFHDYAWGAFTTTYRYGHLIDTANVGATTVTCSTVGDAANYAVDDYVMLHGYDQQFAGFPINARYHEWRKVTDVDTGTGVITLDRPIGYKYRSDWYEYTSYSHDVGRARIINLSEAGDNQIMEYFGLYGLTCLPEPTYGGGGDGLLDIKNALVAEVVDCKAPKGTVGSTEFCTFRRCNFYESMEVDKNGGQLVFEDCDIKKLLEGSGYDSITIKGGRVWDSFYMRPRNLVVDGVVLESELNNAMIHTPSAYLTRNMEVRNVSLRPASTTQRVMETIARKSFTVASSVDATTISVTADAAARTALGSLDMGSLIFTSPTISGPPKRGVVSEIYENGGAIYIEADFDATPSAAEVWYFSSVWNLTVGNIDQVGDYAGIPLETGGLFGVDRLRDLTAHGNGMARLQRKSVEWSLQEADKNVTINGYLKSISVWVQEEYTGADGTATLYLYNLTPTTGGNYCEVDLKTVGLRELFVHSTQGATTNDVLNALSAYGSAGMPFCHALQIHEDGTAMTNTDQTELPIVLIEIEYLTIV